MVSILSFDSRSMEYLLDDEFSKLFSEKYPFFYKNKISKGIDDNYFYRNAIQNSLKNNSIRAVDIILKYIVKYQNNVSSSYLLCKIMTEIIDMGIEVCDVFNSKIFNFEFDYDEWPGTHTNEESCFRPYNGSIYKIRNSYRMVFPEDEFEEMNDDAHDKIESSKVFKISYSVNLLPLIGQHIDSLKGERILNNTDVSFLDTCANSDELDMFKCQSLQDVIEFKWNEFGFNFHFIGSAIHAL
jgi:hypothetical protein